MLPAFEQARARGRLEPLRPFVDLDALDPARHVLTGRKYLLFGPEQRDLFNLRPLLVEALDTLAAERLDVGASGAAFAKVLREGGHERLLSLWEPVLDWDHNLPDWMRGYEGPGLVPPPERKTLRDSFVTVFDLPEVRADARLYADLQRMHTLVDACADDDGLGLTCRVTGGESPTWAE